MIETQLLTVLNSDTAVTALVSDRVFALKRDPNKMTLPAVVYQRSATAPDTHLEGDSGLDYVRVQCSCWAKTYGETKELSAAVRAAVNASTLKSRTLMELDDPDSVTGENRVILEFGIWQ